jgi:hypothetical protein
MKNKVKMKDHTVKKGQRYWKTVMIRKEDPSYSSLHTKVVNKLGATTFIIDCKLSS